MYIAKAIVDVIFISEADGSELIKDAQYNLLEDGAEPKNVSIKEIKSVKDIPEEWINAVPYGQDQMKQMLNTVQLLVKIKAENKKMDDPEYKQYLKLKKKFEDK